MCTSKRRDGGRRKGRVGRGGRERERERENVNVKPSYPPEKKIVNLDITGTI